MCWADAAHPPWAAVAKAVKVVAQEAVVARAAAAVVRVAVKAEMEAKAVKEARAVAVVDRVAAEEAADQTSCSRRPCNAA